MPNKQPIVFFFFIVINLFGYKKIGYSQELYPMTEPASTLPKNVLGIRLFSETYKEINQFRNMAGLRLMYGITPKWTAYLTGIASNHHGKKFPVDFPYHNTPERGALYPYKLNGVHLYSKYRFLSIDKPNEHLRLAIYGELARVKTTHHETEPNLMMGDNSGFGGGLIATYLKGKFAISTTLGAIFPSKSNGMAPDPISSFPDIPITVYYGKALNYSLSMGYLLFPKDYENYKQTNWNVYLEFTGKYFDKAKVDMFVGTFRQYQINYFWDVPALMPGYYVDINPGIQAIINSNLRIDACLNIPFINSSYAKMYPAWTIGIQYYLY